MGASIIGMTYMGAIFAFASGYSFYRFFALMMQKQRHAQTVKESLLNERIPDENDPATLYNKTIEYMETLTQSYAVKRRRLPEIVLASAGKAFIACQDRAGLRGCVKVDAFVEARIRLAVIVGLVAFAIGLIFSTELGLLLLFAGFIFGWLLPSRAVGHRVVWRSLQMEEHLPEMLDVIALGMRSGLSFDASLKLYSSHFTTILAHEISLAQCQWESGLERRDEALRCVAASYDSAIFGRVIETMIRSVRFGSSMVSNLEDDAREARSIYRARKEEQIAKAPVKMMIPTSTLILPAMLIVVLGPVLLELMGGVV